MKLRGGIVLCVAAMGLAVGGCSSYSAPALKVSQVRVAERTETGVVLDFAIEATNHNEIELPLRDVRYSVCLDGTVVFRGVRSPEASLRRLGTQTIHVPAVVPPESTNGTVRYVIDGKLGYTTPGQFAQVLFDIKVKRPTVAFRDEGAVELGAK